ncbi:MAG: hypothetical protein RIC35_25110 [Marinoscillum sp.]
MNSVLNGPPQLLSTLNPFALLVVHKPYTKQSFTEGGFTLTVTISVPKVPEKLDLAPKIFDVGEH